MAVEWGATCRLALPLAGKGQSWYDLMSMKLASWNSRERDHDEGEVVAIGSARLLCKSASASAEMENGLRVASCDRRAKTSG